MAKDDTNRLVDRCLSFAKSLVESRGEFFPFAATLASDGKVNILQAGFVSDESEETWRETLIQMARESIKEEGSSAAALCFNGNVTPSGQDTQSAILIDAEDTDGNSFQIVQPYKKKKLFKGYSYGEIMGQPIKSKLFN